MSSSSASLVATARDRRNRRLATFKGGRGNADRVEVSLDDECAPELPTSPAQLPSTASDGKINNKTTMVPVTMALEDAASHSSKTLPVPPTGIHVLSMRTWDVDDAPRPRLSPRVNQTMEAAAVAADSSNKVPALLTLPDDLLQSHNVAPAALITPPKLAPRWWQRPPSSSAYTPPRGQLARKVSSSSLPSNLSHGQYAANNNVGGASGASAANSLSRVKSKTTNVEPPDDVSSLGDGGVDDDSSPHQYPTNSLARMTQALQAAAGSSHYVKMPYGLNRQERQLWETCMSVFEKAKNNNFATDVKQQEAQSTHVASSSSSQAKGKLPGNEDDSVHNATDETTKLAKELEEKSLALENAKMIITSLEQASGSLAADLRSKLKAKDDAIHSLTVDAADKQKRLDSLATQLRDLQRNVPMHSIGGSTTSKQQRQLALTARLEKNVRDVHAQACDMKASDGGDASALERVGAALDDSISAMKASLQLLHETMPEASFVETDASSVDSSVDATRSPTPAITMPSDPRRLHRELEEKTRQLHRVEDALKRQREETKRLKEESHRHNDNQVDSMRQEILSLREQCQTNMELLAKKERELAVLRDSLKVDDGDVGYISDDATEASELEETRTATPASSSLAITTYSPSQTEALATLLAHGGGQIFSDTQQGSILKEMRHLHDELIRARTDAATYQKQWRLETESLVNAKMIISSLEKANKSMMQESRTRLQDSNTAIASLLEKSMEGERTTIQLRRDLEKLRNEKEQEAESFEMQIKQLRARNLTSSEGFFEATFPSSPISDMFTEYKYAMETID
ncbi:hypothetical protein MPSEU_000220800 [Mayamaea pseudoterrestris]|nr:hypothetical protein MPSEU_000220800 [Mayamaea pseudoterrestris]